MWAPWVVIVLFAGDPGLHPLVPARRLAAKAGRTGADLRRHADAALHAPADGHGHGALAPLSLPQDIQMQTIYTVVSKPVRRLELIWGRIIGYMAIVTALTC